MSKSSSLRESYSNELNAYIDQEKAAVEDVTLGDVKEAIETGRLPDGSKLEPPTT